MKARHWIVSLGVLCLGSALPAFGGDARAPFPPKEKLFEGEVLRGVPLDLLRYDDALRNRKIYAQGGDLVEQFIRFLFPTSGRERRTIFLPIPYWGPKKPQYKKFDWHRYESPHFNFFTYPEGEAFLPEVIQLLEVEHERNNRIFGVENRFTKKIPVLFYQTRRDFEQSTIVEGPVPEGLGGLTEIFSWRRVTFPFEGEMQHLAHVSKHEQTHVYQIAKGAHRLPLWFIEGTSETNSIKWDAEAEITLRDAYLNNFPLSISTLWMIEGTWLMYKLGNFITNLIWEEYGEEGFRKIFDNAKDMPFDENLKASLGITIEELDGKVVAEIARQFGHLLNRKDILASSDKLDERRVLLHANGDFYLSGGMSGPRLAIYVNFVDLDGKIYRKEVVGDRKFHNESLSGFRKGAWMDAKRIAYAIKRSARDVVRVVPYAFDRGLHKFALGEAQEFSWPDIESLTSPVLVGEKRLAFVGFVNGYSNLYLYDWGTGKREMLTTDRRHYTKLDYSPDRNEIVFSREDDPMPYRAHYDRNLYTLNLETRVLTQLTNTPSLREDEPRFSPDGTRVVYVYDPEVTYDLGMVDLATGRSNRITRMRTGVTAPQWAGSGVILFNAFKAFAPSIYRARFPSAKQRLLVEMPGREVEPIDLEAKTLRILPKSPAKASPQAVSGDGIRFEAGRGTLWEEGEPFRIRRVARLKDRMVFSTRRGEHGAKSVEVDNRDHFFVLHGEELSSLAATTVARKGTPEEIQRRMNRLLGDRAIVESWTSPDRKQALVLVNNRLAVEESRYKKRPDLELLLYDMEADTIDRVMESPIRDLDARLQWVAFLADGKVFLAEGEKTEGPFSIFWYDRIFKKYVRLDEDVNTFRVAPNLREIAWRKGSAFSWIRTSEASPQPIEGVKIGTRGRTAFQYLSDSRLMFFAASEGQGEAQIFAKGGAVPESVPIPHDPNLRLVGAAIDSFSPMVALRAETKGKSGLPEKLLVFNTQTKELREVAGKGIRFPEFAFRQGYLTYSLQRKNSGRKERWLWHDGQNVPLDLVSRGETLEDGTIVVEGRREFSLYRPKTGAMDRIAGETAGYSLRGSEVFFSAPDKSRFQLHVYDLDKRSMRKLTFTQDNEVQPVVTGDELLWASDATGDWKLKTSPVDDPKRYRLIGLEGFELIGPREEDSTAKASAIRKPPQREFERSIDDASSFPLLLKRQPASRAFRLQSLMAAAAYDGDDFRFLVSGFADNLFSDRGVFVNAIFFGDAKFATAGIADLTTGRSLAAFYNATKYVNDDDEDVSRLDNAGAEFTQRFTLDRYREVSVFGTFEWQGYGDTDPSIAYEIPPDVANRNFYLLKTGAVYGYDVTVWDNHGPISGSRLYVRAEAGFDAGNQRLSNVDTNIDFRYYNAFLPRLGLAHRLVAGTSQGDLPTVFLLGGNLSFRGVDFDDLKGQNYWVFSEDVRVPVFDFIGAKFFDPADAFLGWLTRYFDVRGGIYTDVGGSWFNEEKYDTIYSVGYFVNVPTIFGMAFRWAQGFAGETGISFWVGGNW